MNIAKYLDPALVLHLDVANRDEAIGEMVDALHLAGKLEDKEAFRQALLNREKIVSTGIGMGVAIPHAKLPEYENFFIALARLERGIDWNALDNAPIRIIFMIGGPDDKQTEYLRILSTLTEVIKDEEKRKKMINLSSTEEIMQLLAL